MFMPDRLKVRALLAFRAAHGRCWKAKLLFLWSTGREVEEADGDCPRQRRNQAGPAWLNQLSPYRWRAIGRLAEPGDRQTALRFLDRAREFHEGARLGAAVALAPALHLLAISSELGLEAYLMSRGWSNPPPAPPPPPPPPGRAPRGGGRARCSSRLIAACDEARRLGLPSPGRILVDLLTSLGPAYAAHRIDALVVDGYVCDFAATLRAMARSSMPWRPD